MAFPVAFTVSRRPFTGLSSDGIESVPTWGAPVDVGVYAIAPAYHENGVGTLTETEIADIDLFMPKTAVSVQDRFVIDGETFEVVKVEDWTRGFHGWQPGIVVKCRRVD